MKLHCRCIPAPCACDCDQIQRSEEAACSSLAFSTHRSLPGRLRTDGAWPACGAAAAGGRPDGSPPTALGRHTDVGHWDLSPEWFGTQAGGWGRGAGEVVFQQRSELGNGEVGGNPILP